jgi:two-component system KDP operon response regulator KdpE
VVAVGDAESDKIAALDAGASDYIAKPVKSAEFLARIRALLRRVPAAHAPCGRMTLGAVHVDFDTRHVTANGGEAHLMPREFDSCNTSRRTRTRSCHRGLLQHARGPDYGGEVDVLRVVINQLRRKLEADAAKPMYLLTEPYVGYRLYRPGDPAVASIDLPNPSYR